MTDAQERFCQEYLIDLNATAAYQRAYPNSKPKSAEAAGSRLLGNGKVSARIAALQAKRATRLEVTQDYVITRLMENVERAMQAESVRDREGNLTGEYIYAGAVANGALGLLGKHLGMFIERHGNPDGTPLLGTQVHVHMGDNGRGISPPARVANGNGARA